MSVSATGSREWLTALAAGCERLISPAVESEEVRRRQGRLIGVLLVGSFLVAAAVAQVMLLPLGISTALAIVCSVLAVAWSAVVLVAVSGKDSGAGIGVLAAATAVGGLVLACAGGMASPLALLAVGLGVETWWVRRTRNAALVGAAAVAGALLLQAAIGWTSLVSPVAISAWHWFLPAIYAGSLVSRLRGRLGASDGLSLEEPSETLEGQVDGVVLRMAENGDVSRVSPQARDLLGLQPELLHGSGLFDRIHVGDRIGYLAALADLREGAFERECELKLRLPIGQTPSMAGNYRHFALRLVRSPASGPVVAFLRDNSAVAALREQLADALEDAESNDVAKSRFLASVSHELRTPLNAIIGFSDMMLHGMCGAFEEPRQQEYVGLIRESSNHLLGVVNAILDVSKIESGAYDVTLEHFRFAEAVEMCRDMMALQAEAKNIALEVRIAASVGEVMADRRSVRQMIINLVSNAIKFTPEGGCVSIAASRVGSLLHFSVSDNGIGIAEEDLARLGRPFTQVQNDYTRQFEGAGLGLSLVKGLVSLHHGAMTIESAPGEGTTVAISLPADGPERDEETGRTEVRRLEPAEKNGGMNGTLRKIA